MKFYIIYIWKEKRRVEKSINDIKKRTKGKGKKIKGKKWTVYLGFKSMKMVAVSAMLFGFSHFRSPL